MKKLHYMLLIFLFTGCAQSNQEEQKDTKADTTQESIKVGNGEHFYAEEVYPEKPQRPFMLYHSIVNCPASRTGTVRKDWMYSDLEYRNNHSLFCSHCMTDHLIDLCYEYLHGDEEN